VYPFVAIAEEIKRLAPEYHAMVQMRFIGHGELIAREAKNLGISFRHVLAPKWRRYASWKNLFDILKTHLHEFLINFFKRFISSKQIYRYRHN